MESERNGAFAAKPLGESPHNSSLVGIFRVLFLLYIPSLFRSVLFRTTFLLRRPFCCHFYRFVCIGRGIYPKVHGCSPKCLVKYVIFHFLSCMLIAHKEKHHIEIMRRLRCGYLKSQIGSLQSHGQSKYLPFSYIKSYKKESEQARNTTSRCKNFGVHCIASDSFFRKTLLRYVDFYTKRHAIVIAPLVFTNPGCLLRRYRP